MTLNLGPHNVFLIISYFTYFTLNRIKDGDVAEHMTHAACLMCFMGKMHCQVEYIVKAKK